MEFKDYYALLGISPQASEKEIRQAFRRLAHKFHPDKHGKGEDSGAYYLAFSEAYKVLSSAPSRKAYDREFHLHGKSQQAAPDPVTLIHVLQDINRRLDAPHLHQIDMLQIRDFVREFLTGPQAATLLRSDDEEWVRCCLAQLSAILARLPDRFIPGLYAEMGLLLQADKAFKSSMEQLLKKTQRNLAIRQLYPYLVVVLTFLVCLGMYFYAKR